MRKILLAGRSIDLVNFHVGVDGEIGIANGGAGRCGQMPRRSREITAGTFDGVGITVAFGAGHGNGMGGDEFAERSAMAVGGDEGVLRVGNLEEVGSNARQGDGLRGSRAAIGGRHALQIKVVHNKEKRGSDQKANE